MKKQLLLTTIFFQLTALFAQSAWEPRADFPGDGRSAVSSFSFIDYGYIGLGYDGEDFRRSFYAYDPSTDNWFQTESLGGAAGSGMDRNLAASFTIGTKGYIGTGQGGAAFLNDFWEYDYTNNTWALLPNVGGIDRRAGIGFSVNGKGYIGLGQDAGGYRKDLWQFDTTANAWTQKADFTGTPRRLAVSFVVDNRVFVGTGEDGAFKNDFYEYNAVSNSWIVRTNFGGSPRYGATGFGVNGKGYITCGYDTTLTNRKDFWEYDPLADSWTQLEDFPGQKRANATAFVVDTLAFVGMGYDTSFMYDIWMWGDTTNIEIPQAINNIANSNIQLSINPNPVSTNAIIIIDFENITQAVELKIFDLHGADVSNLFTITQQARYGNKVVYNARNNNLPPGIYQCVAIDKKIIGVKNFVVL